ncbi:MAG: hypothetical protein H0V81_02475 [Solirubrobacterales bacterium]|nr:hypothetical protein [Solirubrobacterales bacterium]
MRRPLLSLCLVTASPAAQVAAVLQAWHPVVDEIVLGIDERGDGRMLAEADNLADRVLVLPAVPSMERYLGVLHGACSGEWILRVDDDELPSARLSAALPSLMAEPDLTHVWLPRHSAFPTPESCITSLPWAHDLHVRLVRNSPGLWRFSGRLHGNIEVLGPSRVASAPLLHALLLLRSVDERRALLKHYDALAADTGADAADWKNLYLPEDVDDLAFAPLDPADAAAIRRVMDAHATAPRPRTIPSIHPRVTFTDTERWLEDRELGPEDHAATLELIDAVQDGPAGSVQNVRVEVTNNGNGFLPRGPDPSPPVFVAYRWFGADESPVESHLPRTSLTETVAPGAATQLVVAIVLPRISGASRLVIELVHEHVAWFGVAASQWVTVQPPAETISDGPAAASPAEPPDDLGAALGRLLGRTALDDEVEQVAGHAVSPAALLDAATSLAKGSLRPPARHFANFYRQDLADLTPPPGTLSPDGEVVVGEDGWLFLVAGTNAVVQQFLGRAPLPPEWLDRWASLVERRVSAVRSLGAEATLLVVPDKLALLERHFPEPLTPSGPRPIERLVQEAGLPLLYPREALLTDAERSCLRTDTHLTFHGNEQIHRAVCAELGVVPDFSVPDDVRHRLAPGDLGSHFDPPILGMFASGEGYGAAQLHESNYEQVRAVGGHIGTRTIMRNPEARDHRTLVIFGDSYGFGAPASRALGWSMAQCLREVHFVWVPMGWDPDYVEATGAELVVCQTAERFLSRHPREQVNVLRLADENIRRRRVNGLGSVFQDTPG